MWLCLLVSSNIVVASQRLQYCNIKRERERKGGRRIEKGRAGEGERGRGRERGREIRLKYIKKHKKVFRRKRRK